MPIPFSEIRQFLSNPRRNGGEAFLERLMADYLERHRYDDDDQTIGDRRAKLAQWFSDLHENGVISHDDRILLCSWDEELRFEEDGRTLASGEWVSRQAFEESGFTCDHCNQDFHEDDSNRAYNGSRRVCDSCLSEHYEHCECHDTYVQNGDCDCEDEDEDIHSVDATTIRPVGDNGYGSPESANLRAPSSDFRLINDYSTNVLEHLTSFKRAPGEKIESQEKTLWLGVELEVNRRDKAPNDYIKVTKEAVRDFAMLKRDSSLDEQGFEIVSIPATLKWHLQAWDTFFQKAAPKLKSWTDPRCGMHVHINRSALSTLAQGKLVVFMNSRNNREFVTAIAGRSSNAYCAYQDATRIRHARAGTSEHRTAVAFSKRNRGGTIEIRIFRGNVARFGFFKNLEFCHAICIFMQNASANQLTYQEFISWFKQPNVRANYPHLAKWLADRNYIEPFVKQRPGVEPEQILVEA